MKVFSKPLALILAAALIVSMFTVGFSIGTTAADSDVKILHDFNDIESLSDITGAKFKRVNSVITPDNATQYPKIVDIENQGKGVFVNQYGYQDMSIMVPIGKISDYEAIAIWVDTSDLCNVWDKNRLAFELSQGTVDASAVHGENMYSLKGEDNVNAHPGLLTDSENLKFIYTDDTEDFVVPSSYGKLAGQTVPGVPAGTTVLKSGKSQNNGAFGGRNYVGLGYDWNHVGKYDVPASSGDTSIEEEVFAIKFKGWIVIPFTAFKPHTAETPAWNLDNDFYFTFSFTPANTSNTNNDNYGVKYDSIQLLKTVDATPIHQADEEPSSTAASSEDTSSEDTSSTAASSEDTSSEDTSSTAASSEDTSSEDTSSEDTSSEDTSSEDTSSQAPTVEPGQNIIPNPSFEGETHGDLPSGWTVEGLNATIHVGDSHTGNSLLSIWNDTDILNVNVYRTLTNLPEGKYNFTAFTKAWGTISEAYLYVKDQGGDEVRYDIPNRGDWQELILSDINVTSGQATIGIVVKGSAGAGASIDDISFALAQLSGGEESSQAQSQASSQAQSEASSQAQSQAPSQAQSQASSQAQSQAPSQSTSQAESQATSQTESKGSANTGDTNPMLYVLLMLALATAVIFVTIPKKANN